MHMARILRWCTERDVMRTGGFLTWSTYMQAQKKYRGFTFQRNNSRRRLHKVGERQVSMRAVAGEGRQSCVGPATRAQDSRKASWQRPRERQRARVRGLRGVGYRRGRTRDANVVASTAGYSTRQKIQAGSVWRVGTVLVVQCKSGPRDRVRWPLARCRHGQGARSRHAMVAEPAHRPPAFAWPERRFRQDPYVH